MAAIPHGTVTFLFTDVEGSTRLWELAPAAMQQALAFHDEILRSVIEAHRGYVFSTAGDAFSAAFSTPGDAIGAAVAAQHRLGDMRWPEPVALRVRMGLHTGTADERDGDYFGPAVNRAARIMSAAHGGQVLVSLASEELVRDRLPDGAAFIDVGEHVLPGLGRPERMFQLTAPGLRRDFRPLRSGELVTGNLPRPLTSFVGRAEELKRLAADLLLRRLVTLSGPGGVGKTRLALEAARLAAEEYPAGAWLVELAPTGDPRAVPAVAAEALRVTPQASSSPADSVVDALTGRRALVVVDNAEHVLDAVAELVGRIVSTCPEVTVLVTSREPLGIAGEQVWPVPPLDPVLEGVELFDERAQAVDGSHDGNDRDSVKALCTRLDGIPLAIELAAARARSMSAQEMLARLDDRFRLLRGAGRGRPGRHQTLQAAVDWSYQLLAENERMLFDRLAIFAGTFDLAAAEAVCADDTLDAWDVDDLLRVLVDKSMVVASPAVAGTRYHLLETLRQYARDRLDARGEHKTLERRHISHYLSVAKQAQSDYEGTANAVGRARFEAEWDNLRAAVASAVAASDVAAAEGLVVASFWYAYWGLNHEHSGWAAEALRLAEAGPDLHGINGMWALIRGALTDGLRHGKEAIAAAPEPDHPDTAIGWMAIGIAHAYLGDRNQARPAILKYRELADGIGDPWLMAQASACTCTLLTALSGYDDATVKEAAQTALRISEGLGNPAIGAYVAWAMSFSATRERRFDDAMQWNNDAADLAELSGNRFVAGVATMGAALTSRRTLREPNRAHADALHKLYASRDWLDIWMVIESLALLLADTGRPEPAAVLLGYLQYHDIYYSQRRRAQAIRALEQQTEGAAWLARGAQLDRHALIAYALRVLNDDQP